MPRSNRTTKRFPARSTTRSFALKHATALINGRVQDKLGNPVFGISLFANADFGQYNAFALSDSNGLYSMAIDAGVGTVNVQNPANPPASNFIWPDPQFGINDGQLVSLNVTAWLSPRIIACIWWTKLPLHCQVWKLWPIPTNIMEHIHLKRRMQRLFGYAGIWRQVGFCYFHNPAGVDFSGHFPLYHHRWRQSDQIPSLRERSPARFPVMSMTLAATGFPTSQLP